MTRLILGLVLFAASYPVLVLARTDVLVVRADRNAVHAEVVDALRSGLGDALDQRIRVQEIGTETYAGDDIPPRADIVVTVGVDAAAVALRKPATMPLYCTFLPQTTFAALTRDILGQRPARGRISALYLDQPLARRLQLLRLAVPQIRRLGVVLGPESRASETVLQQMAASQQMSFNIEIVSDEKQLIGALHGALSGSDALFAVPDTLVFNRRTAENILLTTYRLGKPVVAYSRSYVTAGALLAVYSTPAQIGHQIGETLRALPPSSALPPPQHPRYFDVEVNEHVARSLGLNLESGQELARRLAVLEAGGAP